MKCIAIVLSLLFSVAVNVTFAQEDSVPTPIDPTPVNSVPAVESAAIPNDNDNYVSDRLSFPVGMWVTEINLADPEEPLQLMCAPAGTQLRGIGRRNVKVEGKTDPVERTVFLVEKLAKHLNTIDMVRDIFSDVPPNAIPDKDNCSRGKLRIVEIGQTIVLSHERIDTTNPVRKGITFGTLLIPYKYFLGDDKAFTGGSTLGGYLGYRVDRTGFSGFESNFVVFAGATSIAVPETVDGTETISNRAGASYGFGVLATVKEQFQIGLVVGQDRTDDAAQFARNGDTWLALSFGYEFLN